MLAENRPAAKDRQGKKEKATFISERGLYYCRQRPTLPHTFACSTIGPAGLDFRVRYGNGYFPRGKITGFVDVGLAAARFQGWVADKTCYVEIERAIGYWLLAFGQKPNAMS